MDYAEALEAAKKLDNGAEIVNAIMSEVKKKGDAEKDVRTKFNSYKDEMGDTFKKFGIDPEKPIDSLKTLKESIEQGKLAQTEKGTLEESLQNLRKTVETLEAESKASKETIAKRTKKALKDQLAKDFKDKIYGHDVNAENLVLTGKVKIDENEKVVFIGDDGADVDYKTGLSTFIDSHVDKITKQNGGSSSNPTSQKNQTDFISRDQYQAMSPAEQTASHEKAMASSVDW